ncbi:MAG: hypothetical protein ABMA25_24975, partial [Ilumatobacteraceae bacterium]
MRLESLHFDIHRFRHFDVVIVVAGGIYVVAGTWAMTNLKYDIWGAFLAVPLITAILGPLIAVAFRSAPDIVRVLYAGLALKCVGTIARYWVAFDAYGGAADSQAYHDFGRIYAEKIRTGDVPPWGLIPHGQGTRFLEHLTGAIYTLTGSSKLAGFMWFSALGFGGMVLCIKAVTIAAPNVAHHRYALMCCLCPSLVFWPSSVGKESWMSLSFGVMTLGIAKLFATTALWRPLVLTVLGAVGTLVVRPHIAAVWIAAAVAAVIWRVVGRRTGSSNSRATSVIVLLVGVIGLVVVGRVALQFLGDEDASESVSTQLNDAFDLTLKRTAGGGSEFRPPSVATPIDYPVAVLRTITRPLLHEVTGLSTLLPAIETTAIIILAAFGFRRLMALPGALRRSPFVVFHLLVVVMGALAYSSFSNLAILVRQ